MGKQVALGNRILLSSNRAILSQIARGPQKLFPFWGGALRAWGKLGNFLHRKGSILSTEEVLAEPLAQRELGEKSFPKYTATLKNFQWKLIRDLWNTDTQSPWTDETAKAQGWLPQQGVGHL